MKPPPQNNSTNCAERWRVRISGSSNFLSAGSGSINPHILDQLGGKERGVCITMLYPYSMRPQKLCVLTSDPSTRIHKEYMNRPG